ncbi:MAG: M28 family peptidase [Balneolaceae bacterium]|nr:M28 family peptidase [Balneolaceae bacterium]MCH8549087.1 M28 family peptidase [Balneolaceae bacterium]
MKLKNLYLTTFLISLLVISCAPDDDLEFSEQGREVPAFDSERAVDYIRQQVELGPRVPGTETHRDAMDLYRDHFRSTAGNQAVFVQEFEQVVYGDTLQLYNLIAAFGLEHSDRIVLAAHWDTRPRGEEDPENPELPIPGADDGASGVGVLMEFANIFAEHDLPIGVDIILFDGEDYGEEGDLDNYFLGSRYWSQNPPVAGYAPRFGILLDMVGGEGALFPKEGHSMRFAPSLVNEIWSIADEFGYSDLFIDERGGMIADDHIIVQQYTGIPMINIIHHRVREDGSVAFPPYWHTQDDNMDIIDSTVIQRVGDVVLELIYNRIEP